MASAPHVVAKLLAAYFGVDARKRPRLAQCLAVFFPALASAPADRRRLIAEAALPALRAAAAEKGIARVASYLAHLLTCAPPEAAAAAAAANEEGAAAAAAAAAGPAPAAGGDVLAVTLVKVALAEALRTPAQGITASEKTRAKAYGAALAKLAAAVPLRRTDTIEDAEERAAAETMLERGVGAAVLAGGRVTEKTTAGLFAAAADAMRTAAGLGDGSELADDAEEGVAAMVMEECRALADSEDEQLRPAAVSVSGKKPSSASTSTAATTKKRNTKTAPAAGRRRRSNSAVEYDDDSSDDDDDDEDEDDDDEEHDEEGEEEEAPATPPPAKREAPKRASRSTVAKAEEAVPTAKTTRSTRATRAALKENVAH